MPTSSPHVMLDLRMVTGPLHGIARYALELAARLPRLAPDWRFTGLTGPDGLPAGLGPLHPRLPLFASRAGFLSPLEQPALAESLLRQRPSLFHATSFSLPLLWPGRLVATLHDANHLALPELYGRAQRLYYRAVVRPRARLATALITVSDFSREELARHLELSPYRLQVIPQGVDARYAPQSASEIARQRTRLGLPQGYLLSVGNAKAFKNLALLGRIAERLPLPLVVLAGGETVPARLGLPPSVRCLPAQDEDALPGLFAGASALLFPSRYEGFGLPALEAMASGVPVIASDGSSLRELVDGAGILLSPDDADGWVSAVLRLQRDAHFTRGLVEHGLARAARLSWDVCTQRTLGVYRRALELPAPEGASS